MNSVLTKRQVKKLSKNIMVDGKKGRIEVEIRYDDECNNGHNSFAITGAIYSHLRGGHFEQSGCIHEEIAKHFPELKPFIKWHLMSSGEPMHYVSNTLYHARDTDYNGLKKGEYGAYTLDIVADLGKKEPSIVYTSGQMYVNNQNNPNLQKSNRAERAKIDVELAEIKSELNPKIIKTFSEYSLSEGNPSNLEAARSCAIWPDATLEQLQDKELLELRLPQLIADFKQAVELLGFTY